MPLDHPYQTQMKSKFGGNIEVDRIDRRKPDGGNVVRGQQTTEYRAAKQCQPVASDEPMQMPNRVARSDGPPLGFMQRRRQSLPAVLEVTENEISHSVCNRNQSANGGKGLERATDLEHGKCSANSRPEAGC
jgi:hypothetical protein